jgi:hypothetical protein
MCPLDGGTIAAEAWSSSFRPAAIICVNSAILLSTEAVSGPPAIDAGVAAAAGVAIAAGGAVGTGGSVTVIV